MFIDEVGGPILCRAMAGPEKVQKLSGQDETL